MTLLFLKMNKNTLFIYDRSERKYPTKIQTFLKKNNSFQSRVEKKYFTDNQVDRRSFMSIEKCEKCSVYSPLGDSWKKIVNVLRTIDLRFDTYSIDI